MSAVQTLNSIINYAIIDIAGFHKKIYKETGKKRLGKHMKILNLLTRLREGSRHVLYF